MADEIIICGVTFSTQGSKIIASPQDVVIVAIPMLLYFPIMWFATFWIMLGNVAIRFRKNYFPGVKESMAAVCSVEAALRRRIQEMKATGMGKRCALEALVVPGRTRSKDERRPVNGENDRVGHLAIYG